MITHIIDLVTDWLVLIETLDSERDADYVRARKIALNLDGVTNGTVLQSDPDWFMDTFALDNQKLEVHYSTNLWPFLAVIIILSTILTTWGLKVRLLVMYRIWNEIRSGIDLQVNKASFTQTISHSPNVATHFSHYGDSLLIKTHVAESGESPKQAITKSGLEKTGCLTISESQCDAPMVLPQPVDSSSKQSGVREIQSKSVLASEQSRSVEGLGQTKPKMNEIQSNSFDHTSNVPMRFLSVTKVPSLSQIHKSSLPRSPQPQFTSQMSKFGKSVKNHRRMMPSQSSRSNHRVMASAYSAEVRLSYISRRMRTIKISLLGFFVEDIPMTICNIVLLFRFGASFPVLFSIASTLFMAGIHMRSLEVYQMMEEEASRLVQSLGAVDSNNQPQVARICNEFNMKSRIVSGSYMSWKSQSHN